MLKFKIKGGQFIFAILLLSHMPGKVCLMKVRIFLVQRSDKGGGLTASKDCYIYSRVKTWLSLGAALFVSYLEKGGGKQVLEQ